MAASVQLSPSCCAHILQHSQPSVMRLTPSGQRGGDGGHAHGHLQNWGRADVSSRGAAVKAMATGAGERACGANGRDQCGLPGGGLNAQRAWGHRPIFAVFQGFTGHRGLPPSFCLPDTSFLLRETGAAAWGFREVKPMAESPLGGRFRSASARTWLSPPSAFASLGPHPPAGRPRGSC